MPVPGRAIDALDIYLCQVRPELMTDPGTGSLFLTTRGTRVSKSLLERLAFRVQ